MMLLPDSLKYTTVYTISCRKRESNFMDANLSMGPLPYIWLAQDVSCTKLVFSGILKIKTKLSNLLLKTLNIRTCFYCLVFNK